jgi:hypothetical protein
MILRYDTYSDLSFTMDVTEVYKQNAKYNAI